MTHGTSTPSCSISIDHASKVEESKWCRAISKPNLALDVSTASTTRLMDSPGLSVWLKSTVDVSSERC